MTWTFTVKREKSPYYDRLEGRAEDSEGGKKSQYWCFIIGETWCSLDLWPLWPETYELFERFKSRLGPPARGPDHRPQAADLMDGLDEGPILATVWSFAQGERERILADLEAFLAGK